MTSTRFSADNDNKGQSPHSSSTALDPRQPEPTGTTTGNNQKDRPTTSVRPVLRLYEIHASLLYDSFKRELVQNQVVYVDRDRGVILNVCQEGEAGVLRGHVDRRVEVEKIEMGKDMVLVPGFVDVHVHLFLHSYSETTWEDQVTRESLAERTIRATAHARKTIQAGFTTVRDLGTEGALDADVALRKCMAGRKPIIPGPRYYCSTRAIVATGAYGPKNRLYPAQDGVDGITGAAPVDGVDDCVREVRRQIGAGADWIKIYADYRARGHLAPVSSTLATSVITTFNKDELRAMIEAAHQWNVKVAVHADSPKSINALMDLVDEGGGPDTIEHGSMLGLDYHDAHDGGAASTFSLLGQEVQGRGKVEGKKPALERLARADGQTIWVPTLAVHYANVQNTGTKLAKDGWERCQRTFKIALALMLDDNEAKEDTKMSKNLPRQRPMDNIAVGGDTGPFPHGYNALEIVLMRQLGAPWEKVLAWATLGGWKCVRGMEWEESTGEQKINRLERMAGKLFARLGEKVEDEEEEDLELDRGVPFGAIRQGWAADLVVIQGKLDGTPDEFEKAIFHGVNLVMKGGVVYRRDGQEVVGPD